MRPIVISSVIALVLGVGVGRLLPRHHYVRWYETRFMFDADTGRVCNPTGRWGWISYDNGVSIPPCVETKAKPVKNVIDTPTHSALVSDSASNTGVSKAQPVDSGSGVKLDFSKAQTVDLSAGISPAPCQENVIDRALSKK